MLVRREVTDGVEILAISGPVAESDAAVLRQAFDEALRASPRGILVDLSATGHLPAAIRTLLADARTLAPGWPRPALVLCSSSPLTVTELGPLGLAVHPHRQAALARVDDRSLAPRHRLGITHDSLRAPSTARAITAELVAGLELEPLADDLALVVSELVTNAIRYARPPVELEIELGADAVTVAVADGSPGHPTPREIDETREGGRGLQLVDQLALDTGVRPQPPGKTVWAELPRP